MTAEFEMRVAMTLITFVFVGWIAPPLLFHAKPNFKTVLVAVLSALIFFAGATLFHSWLA